MKKRLLSWLLVLAMVVSLIPSTLVTSAFAAGTVVGNTTKYTNELPSTLDTAITDIAWNITAQPNDTIVVGDGQTLIVHGTGGFSNGGKGTPLFEVQSGGHLVLDQITITDNVVGENGAVYVHSGGLLDLGYNDQSARVAPGISGNSRNLVVEDGARVRQNAVAQKPIGIYYKGDLGAPYAIVESGRYTQVDSDLSVSAISSDNTDYKFSLNYGDIYIQRSVPKVLFIDPGARNTADAVFGYAGVYCFRENVANNGVSNLREALWATYERDSQVAAYNLEAATIDQKLYDSPEGTDYTKGSYSFDNIDNMLKYDMIYINGPWGKLTEEGRKKLIDYLNAGGCIYMQAEDTQPIFDGVRAATNVWMDTLGATGFEVQNTPSGAANLPAWCYNESDATEYTKRLTAGMPAQWDVQYTAPIKRIDGVEPIFTARFLDGTIHPFAASYLAGDRADGAKYGRIITCIDANFFERTRYNLNICCRFFSNMLKVTKENRITAAAGYNPNAKITYQATTTTATKPYRTPYAAMQKAVEGNAISLLLKTNTAVEPVTNELLFEKAKLAYEQDSKYAGSTIYADTAGVYVDITKTGEVNLRSGTVTVTPKDATYPLVLNGTMDQDGTAITGGYKITSSTAYTLDADDATTRILTANGGGASITIPNKGESVTVDYGNGKSVTYTAKENNEKVYLGWYQVNKNTPSNVTWTDADKAWYGQTYTTTLTPNAGYEVNGENLTVADTDNITLNGYELTKQGDPVEDPDDKTVTWTTYASTEKDRGGTPKVTVKQQHLHSGGADRNGIAIVTVNDVRADITIGAANGTVNAKAPTIYVVGIGRRTGHADVQLWEYTTVRNTKDGVLAKPVNGWPWEKWIVTSAASGDGTESDYKKDKVTLTSDASKLDTTNETATYTINLETGDKVVVFYYSWHMVEVTIKAVDAEDNPIPDFTPQMVEYEIGEQVTITAPNLPGYTAQTPSQDYTPTENDHEITFKYNKSTGNLYYNAVYVEVDGTQRDLGTFDGGVLVRGQAPNKSAQYAPKFGNYVLANDQADGIASSKGDATAFDGTNDITVTYTYKARTKDIKVYAYVGDATGQILQLDTTSYAGLTTGQTITINAPEIAGYKVKENSPSSHIFFISNDDVAQDVQFFYEKDTSNEAYVLVKLVDSANGNKEIGSYQVPGVKDKAQLISVPAAPYGYKLDNAHAADNVEQTVAPTGTVAPYTAEVTFYFVPNVHTVTIKLTDSDTNQPLNVITNYKYKYEAVDGEDLTVIAPSIYGYTMTADSKSVVKLTGVTKDETVEFKYQAIDKQLVTVHVVGMGPDGKLFESSETVTYGTKAKDVTVFKIPGLKLAGATVDSKPAAMNGNIEIGRQSGKEDWRTILDRKPRRSMECTWNRYI